MVNVRGPPSAPMGQNLPGYRGSRNTMLQSDDKSDEKGRFKEQPFPHINRPYRQAANRAWTIAEKTRERKTARRYARNK